MKTSFRNLIGLAVILAATRGNASDYAFITTTDFSTGSATVVSGSPKTAQINVASVHSDATSRWFDGRIYVVNRTPADNVQVLNPSGAFATVIQFSTGNGSNPHDFLLLSPTRAYVTRYDATTIWIVNPVTGAMTGTISLAALADADGLPEMDSMIRVGNRVFVTVQRLDRNNFYAPAGTSYIAVVDVDTDTLVDTDPGAPGVQSIALSRSNPFSELQLDPYSGKLYVSCVAFFGVLDGGVTTVDPYTLQATGVMFSEAAAGGDILDVEIVGGNIGYAVISTPSFATELIRFNPQAGTKTATIYAPGVYTLQDIDVSPAAVLFLADRSATNPGIRCFNSPLGTPIGTGPLSTGLPPFDITFSVPQQTGVETPAVSITSLPPNYPNPFNPSTTIPFTVTRSGHVSLDVADVSGRVVARLIDAVVEAGTHEASWSGVGIEGVPVASGIYFVRLRAGQTVAVRKIVLLK